MRHRLIVPAGILLTLTVLPVSRAQVVVNQQALDQLAGKPQAAAHAMPAVPAKPVATAKPQRRVLHRNQPLRALPPPPPPAPLPASAAVVPPVTRPQGSATAPQGAPKMPQPGAGPKPEAGPKPKTGPKAGPKAAVPATPRRIAIDFAAGAATPPASAAAAVKGLLGPRPGTGPGAGPEAGTRFLVRATAPGVPGDPSVARRLSLRRGLAVRDILRQSGVPTERIIVQALGDPRGQPTDRVTVTELP